MWLKAADTCKLSQEELTGVMDYYFLLQKVVLTGVRSLEAVLDLTCFWALIWFGIRSETEWHITMKVTEVGQSPVTYILPLLLWWNRKVKHGTNDIGFYSKRWRSSIKAWIWKHLYCMQLRPIECILQPPIYQLNGREDSFKYHSKIVGISVWHSVVWLCIKQFCQFDVRNYWYDHE